MYTDILYLAGTLGFFAAMLAYVRGCERLGRARRPGALAMGAESLIGGLDRARHPGLPDVHPAPPGEVLR